MCLEGEYGLRHVRNLLDFGITSRCREQATRGTKSPGTALSGPESTLSRMRKTVSIPSKSNRSAEDGGRHVYLLHAEAFLASCISTGVWSMEQLLRTLTDSALCTVPPVTGHQIKID